MEWNGMEWNGMEWNREQQRGGIASSSVAESRAAAWRNREHQRGGIDAGSVAESLTHHHHLT